MITAPASATTLTLADGREVSLVPMRWWRRRRASEEALFPGSAWTPEQLWAELAPRAAGWPWTARVHCGYVDVAVAGHDADLVTVAVIPPWQGVGLGGALLREALTAGCGLRCLADVSGGAARQSCGGHV